MLRAGRTAPGERCLNFATPGAGCAPSQSRLCWAAHSTLSPRSSWLARQRHAQAGWIVDDANRRVGKQPRQMAWADVRVRPALTGQWKVVLRDQVSCAVHGRVQVAAVGQPRRQLRIVAFATQVDHHFPPLPAPPPGRRGGHQVQRQVHPGGDARAGESGRLPQMRFSSTSALGDCWGQLGGEGVVSGAAPAIQQPGHASQQRRNRRRPGYADWGGMRLVFKVVLAAGRVILGGFGSPTASSAPPGQAVRQGVDGGWAAPASWWAASGTT